MKLSHVFTTLLLGFSGTTWATERPPAQETQQKKSESVELFMKLSQPDTSRTAIGLSYGKNFRSFVYIDLQDVPATLENTERQSHVPAYALGFSIRDNKIGGENLNSTSGALRMTTDVFIRYSEASHLINRDGFWTLGLQPGLNFSGGGPVSLSLGIEYDVNLIAGENAEKQTQLRNAGVTKTTMTPVLAFNIEL